MLTDWSRLSHAGSFSWVSPLSDPLLLPLWSRSRLIHRSGCWWRVGTCLDLLCCLSGAERERDIHRYTEGEGGREKLVVKALPVWSDPHNGRALQPRWTDSCWCQHPECTHWRRAWMEELHCCLAAWWVSKLCVNKNLSRIILQLSTCASALVNCYCRERISTLKLQKD